MKILLGAMMNPRISKIKDRYSDLFSQRNYLIKRKTSIAIERSSIESFNALNAQVLSVLEQMQSEVQKNAVTDYENLLTQAMRTVLPESLGNVRLNVQLERGRPSMNILVNIDGKEEDIVLGRGGSLSNVLSTALRFIVLNRMPSRRFLVLDEPDCWLRADRIPAFMKMVNDLSRASNIQSLTITHSDSIVRELEGSQIIKISKNSKGFIESEIVKTQNEDESRWLSANNDTFNHVSDDMMEGIGMRYIRLINVMSHTDTLIELSPYSNFIVGDNDIGKSVVVSALKAVFYNDSSDAIIQHDMNEARIELGLEDGMTLVWKRFREAKTVAGVHQKVGYSLLDDSGMVIEEDWGARDVPAFAKEVLSTELIDGEIDVHICHQKTPIFLIGPDTTPSKRAKLLSIGGEMERVRNMIDLYNEEKQKNRVRLKSLNQEIEHIDRALITLRELEKIEDKLTLLIQCDQKYSDNLLSISESDKVVERINNLIRSKEKLDSISLSINHTQKPDIQEEMGAMFLAWRGLYTQHKAFGECNLKFSSKIDNNKDMSTDIELSNDYLLFVKWYKANEILKTLKKHEPKKIDLVELNSFKNNYDGTKLINESIEELALLDKGIKENEVLMGECKQSINSLKERFGGVCPTCNTRLDGHSH